MHACNGTCRYGMYIIMGWIFQLMSPSLDIKDSRNACTIDSKINGTSNGV